jgi:hypothetical protein
MDRTHEPAISVGRENSILGTRNPSQRSLSGFSMQLASRKGRALGEG